jgi:hypothetical protein
LRAKTVEGVVIVVAVAAAAVVVVVVLKNKYGKVGCWWAK